MAQITTTITMISTITITVQIESLLVEGVVVTVSGRLAARCFHSSASPVSTLMMSSTPRVMPPAKSLARKRGTMPFSMIRRETASVRLPSSP